MSTPGQPFDYTAYAKQANEQEQAARNGKVASPPVVEEKKTEEQPKEAEPAERRPLSRSDRRKLTTAIKAAEYERGRREATEQLLQQYQRNGQPEQPKPAGAPKREDFASDAEYAADVAKREVRSEVEKSERSRRESEEINQEVLAANAAHKEQMDFIPEYEDIMHKADKLTKFNDDFLGYLLGTSTVQAHVIEYFVNNPDEWNAIVSAKGNNVKQGRLFAQIEGEARVTYKQRKKAAEAVKEAPKETSAERDAKKAKPSETVTAKGGQPADGTISMMMPDGRTMNPAWKHLQNQKDGLRP